MTKGYVASFDARTRRGFVQLCSKADRIPFETRRAEESLQKGDSVEFSVVGGKAGVMAHKVRPVR